MSKVVVVVYSSASHRVTQKSELQIVHIPKFYSFCHSFSFQLSHALSSFLILSLLNC